MNIFGIGLPEMAVIAAIGLLVFGPKRLPELGKTLGRTLKGFQSASKEFEQEFRKVVDTVEADVTSEQPVKTLEPASASFISATPSSPPKSSSAKTPPPKPPNSKTTLSGASLSPKPPRTASSRCAAVKKKCF
jgi:sec-independent protein translocase protein TatA